MKPIMKRENQKKCFIIMPISTPNNCLQNYSNDKDHFEHVLDHLLMPSLEKADLESIPPITKGSDVIHGSIIKNIDSADLVLCDMSTLNPNVFFELGIRIAMNKPICLIKDDVTLENPFDTAIINCHSYSSALNQWTSKKEIDELSNHIKESFERSNGSNSLWNYFSLSSPAKSVEAEQGVEVRIDYLTKQIEALREQLLIKTPLTPEMVLSKINFDRISQIVANFGGSAEDIKQIGRAQLEIKLLKKLDVDSYNKITGIVSKEFGIGVIGWSYASS